MLLFYAGCPLPDRHAHLPVNSETVSGLFLEGKLRIRAHSCRIWHHPKHYLPVTNSCWLAHDNFDYCSFVWSRVLGAQSSALDSDPELGHGMAGYARYCWRTFTDGVSGIFFTEAIVPTLTHQDPRYYTLGHGVFFRRTGYALSRTFVTKTILEARVSTGRRWGKRTDGGIVECLLSSAGAWPEPDSFRNWGTQMESAARNNTPRSSGRTSAKKFSAGNSLLF